MTLILALEIIDQCDIKHIMNRISGVMVSVLASSAVDCGFKPRCNFSTISWKEQVTFPWDDDVHFGPD
jgi:hypothetical protein